MLDAPKFTLTATAHVWTKDQELSRIRELATVETAETPEWKIIRFLLLCLNMKENE